MQPGLDRPVRSQLIGEALESDARYPDRESGVLERLAVGARREGDYYFDQPFADALVETVERIAGDPRLLQGVLLVAERFARRVGTRQIGPATLRRLDELLWDGVLRRFITNSADVRGAALQLAQACGLPLAFDRLEQEEALKRHNHGLWLAILLGEVDIAVARSKYLEAIDSGSLGIDDLVDQAIGLLKTPGRTFLTSLVEALYRKTYAESFTEADRLIKDLSVLTDTDWSPVADRNRLIADLGQLPIPKDLQSYLPTAIGGEGE